MAVAFPGLGWPLPSSNIGLPQRLVIGEQWSVPEYRLAEFLGWLLIKSSDDFSVLPTLIITPVTCEKGITVMGVKLFDLVEWDSVCADVDQFDSVHLNSILNEYQDGALYLTVDTHGCFFIEDYSYLTGKVAH